MSSLKINRDTLNKLTHESEEIRLRTLEQLSSKLHRALELDENVDFKPSDLCKQLIRWFGKLPPQQPLKVLQLLKSIIISSKYAFQVINKLGSERLIKELRKIQTLFDSQSAEFNIISQIKEFLKKSKSNEMLQSRKPIENLDNLVDHISNMRIEEGLHGFCIEDYEIPWTLPSPSDFRSMKILADILINKFSSNCEIKNSVQHLQLTMADYPAEYLLQAPHIFQNLLQLYDERKGIEKQNVPIDDVALAMLQFLFNLERRLKMSRNSLSFSPCRQENRNGLNFKTPHQLKVEKALSELLDASIYHTEVHAFHGNVSSVVWEIIFLVLKILKIVKRKVNIKCLHKTASVAAKLSTKFAETEHCARLRLHQMLLVFLMQDIAEMGLCPNSAEILEVFEPILRDYTMKSFFTKRYQATEIFTFKADNCLKEKYRRFKLYEESILQSIRLLRNGSNGYSGDIIKEGLLVSKVIDILQSQDLIDVLFDGVVKEISSYREIQERKTHAIDLLLRLLDVTVMPLKVSAYEKLANAFKTHIGCLMTGERYTIGCSNADLLKAQIVGVPLNTDLLRQLVYESFESPSERIKTNCCKIIELLLKSQSLFQCHWYNIISLVLPIMPLLNCCSFSAEIMNLLVKLFDPDLRKLPFICVLQGNIGFLFHSNVARRSEALTRLVYTLNTLKDAENYVPNLLEISDTIPNDICYEAAPRELKNIFCAGSAERSELVVTLNNLLHLLESPDVEPLIRKTTLMQINVLCSDWHVTAELCSTGAFYLILQALENALQKSSKLDYADAVVPAISILGKVMIHDSSLRCELSETPNIYVLLLRALFMFHYDIQVRQDATLCLFLLLFSSYIVSTKNSAECPLILNNIKMPLNVDLLPASGGRVHQELENYSKLFGAELEETKYGRLVVASSYCDGLKNITQRSLNVLSKLDIREELKLTSLEVRFIRATQPNVSLLRLLKAAVNATDHTSLIKICTLLKLQLIVPKLKNTFCVHDDFCEQINGILRRYLQMTPGNEDDFNLYEHLLDIANICLKIPLEPVALEIFKTLHKDPRHALITMLAQADEIPFRIYNRITTFLTLLINEHSNILRKVFAATECDTFYAKLLDFLLERCLQLFEVRDLQRVRCLLSLIAAVSSCELNISDELSFFYCRRFIQLSLALKSFTQTGAQWHRDCLLTVLRLSDKMQHCSNNFRLAANFIKYLSGVCGHNDVEVRTLAWSILNITAKTKALENNVSEQKNNAIAGAELLVNELAFLPGGFMACCLSTMLDADEAVSVRHLAGQLLAVVIRTEGKVEEIEKILESHNFMRLAIEALTACVCVLEMELPMELDTSTASITTTDLISCYTLICIELSQRSAAFLTQLCTKSLMFRLYEILKQPAPASQHLGYLNMVGHICRLYTLCYCDNYVFLQRTICRDAVWLDSFCAILFKIVAPSGNVYSTVNMLQLLLILCKTSTALEHISIKLQEYSIDIVGLFQDALTVKNVKTSFQSCALSILSLLLIKSQPDIDPAIGCNILNLLEGQNVSIKSNAHNEIFQSNKENCSSKAPTSKGKAATPKDEKGKSTISEHLCILLIRLFIHLYPVKVCKFSSPPNLSQQHVTETLALLLKQSPAAQETAENFKFQDKLITIFRNFFEEFATTSCSTYLKRNGASKKLAAIRHLQLLLKLLLTWFSSPNMNITDVVLATDYCKIIIQIWSWLAHSNDLKLTVLQVCSFLSERSLVVCKQFSTVNNSSFQHSVLQLATKMITAESLRVKANSSDCSTLIITAGLRILINCCSCLEGRNALNKMHTLNVFETLYPFNAKAPQSKKDIVKAWLEFWEIFSRYEEGAQSRHLNALCSVIGKSAPGCSIRLTALRILRNMSFLNNNRSTLITSTDFMFTVNEIVAQPANSCVEEQFIVCVALWKLMSGGIKFVAIVRGTKLAKNLRALRENLKCSKETNNETAAFSNELLNVLNIILKLFSS